MNHKRHRPKNRRGGCLMCKYWKVNGAPTGERMRQRREWQRHEKVAA